MASPLYSSLESLKIPTTAESSPAQMQKSGNFLNQLENMMSAVKKEAGALESMKLKIREMEELKNRQTELKSKLNDVENENFELHRIVKESEMQNNEIRTDMQRLNDIYNADRQKFIELQNQNLKLEQELTSSKLEKEFLVKETQKIPDLKKIGKGLKAQLTQLRLQYEEETGGWRSKVADMEKKVAAAEKSKEEAAGHFWNLTEELKSTKKTIETMQQSSTDLTTQLAEAKRVAAQGRDRLLMVAEDLQHTRVRQMLHARTVKADTHTLQFELQNLRSSLANKENELHDISVNYAQLQESSMVDLTRLNSTSAKLQDTVKDLSAKNQELVKVNSAMKQKLATRTTDTATYTTQIEQLKVSLREMETNYSQYEVDSAQNTKALNNRIDDLSFQLQSAAAQLEAAITQSKSDQTRFWEETQRMKESESQLLEECEKLTQELSEKSVRLYALETERTSAENNMRSEVSGASSMVNALKDELEKRLEDLVALRQERDQLLGDKEELAKEAEALRADMAKKEASFKRANEQDRKQVSQELINRANRNKVLENEKQEMLSEMSQLMKEISDSKRAVETFQNEAEDSRMRADKMTEQLEWVKTKNNDQLAELKAANKLEADLREKWREAEAKLKEEIAKLNGLVTDGKKNAGLQLVEMNQQIKSNLEEIDELKRQILHFNDCEKKATIESDRLRSAMETNNKRHEDQTDQMSNELNSIRRELDTTRTKHKITIEAKGKVEMEVISVRNELARADNEIARLTEQQKDIEGTCVALNDKCKQAQAAADAATESSKQMKSRVLELEEAVRAKNNAMDRMVGDMQHLERDGFQETKRLRMQLSSAESEINELKPQNFLLQKEMADVKTNFTKLQSSTSTQINALLHDLGAAEDKLLAERKKTDQVAAEGQAKLVALQGQLDKRKEALDELMNRSRADKGDKELLVMQLESEVERCKATIADKDRTAEELQKQHQTDRLKMHDLNQKVDDAEREQINLKTLLEMETQKTKRLEAKLRQTLSSGEHAAVVRGDFTTSPGVSQGPNFTFDGSSTGGYLSARNNFSRGAADSRDRVPAHPGALRTESRDSGSRHYSGDFDESSSSVGYKGSNVNSSSAGRSIVGESYYSSSYGGNGSSSVYGEQEDYRAMTPSRRTQHEMRDLRGSQSVPTLFNDGVPIAETQQYGSMRSPDGSRRGTSPFGSPRGFNGSISGSSQYSQPSPAAERVSATLAARTTAESSKNALKLAQQQRNVERQSASVSSNSHSLLAQQQLQYQARASASVASNHDPYYDDVPVHSNGSVGSSWNEAPVAPMLASSSINGKPKDDVDERIAQTQRILNQRRDRASSEGGSNAHNRSFNSRPDGDNYSDAAGTSKTPTSGRSHKLNETIQQAHSMYPSQNDASFDSDAPLRTAAVTPMHIDISAPSLHPASPPSGNAGMRFSMGAAMRASADADTALSELNVDFEEGDEEDDDEANYNPGPLSTLGSATSAVSKGGKKLKKKKKKSEDALQLPRLGVNAAAKRR